MSETDAPDRGPAPAERGPGPELQQGPELRQGPERRGLGNLRSLVISMVVVVAAVLAWVAMVPRVREISQPAVDVTSVARQVRRETGWAISQPQLPSSWKATNVRFTTTGDGVRTWHAGYLSPDGAYVAIDQSVQPVAGGASNWLTALTSDGQADGTLSAAGRTWQKLRSPRAAQLSLVSRGSGAAALTTVVSGTAPYVELARFAAALRPVPTS